MAVNDDGVFNFETFKYKAADTAGGNSFVENTKIVIPLKYLRNVRRSLEMSLINCKIHLELNWTEDRILSRDGDSSKLKKKKINYMFL